MSNKQPSPNDQRSVVKQPGTPAYEADRQNRVAIGHPAPPPAPPQPDRVPKPKP